MSIDPPNVGAIRPNLGPITDLIWCSVFQNMEKIEEWWWSGRGCGGFARLSLRSSRAYRAIRGIRDAETMPSLGVQSLFDEILRKFASPRIWCRISDPFSTYGSQYVDEPPNNKHDFPGHSGEARIHWVFLGVKLSTLVESD